MSKVHYYGGIRVPGMEDDHDSVETFGLDEDDTVGEKDGFFKVYHFNVLSALSDDELAAFAACRTDEERLVWLHGLQYVHRMPNVMADIMAKPHFKGKSADGARQRRTDGNKMFQMKNYLRALDLYTEAIVRAPFVNQDEPELALAYANRSAALVHVDEHSRALADIELAIEHGYPIDLRYKLIERRAKCLLALARPVDEVTAACGSAIDAVRQSRLDDAKRNLFERDIKKLAEDAKKGSSHQQKPTTKDAGKPSLPYVTGGQSVAYPALSQKVRIEQSAQCGRYAVADKQIRAGDVIAVERPIASVMNPLKYETNCHHCYRSLPRGAGHPCPKCARVRFCSIECRQQAITSYHKTECALLDVLYAAGISITCYLALRMATIHPPSFYVGLKPVINKPELQTDLGDQAAKYAKAFGLVTHADERKRESFFHITLMADFLLKCLKIGNYFGKGEERNFSDPLNEDESWIGSLLLRHMQVVQFNAHEIAELEMTRPDCIHNAKAKFIGAALFPTVSLFNHSCEPGIVRYCLGDTLVVRAIKTIGEGETVNENYGPIFTRKSREQRQRQLKERYWFDCSCQACTEDWPLIGNLNNDALRFRCAVKTCRKPLVVPTDTMTPFITCPNCKKSNNILTSLQKLQETEEPFKRGAELLQLGDYANALQCCVQTLTKLDEILCPPYCDYIQCQENARRCMLTMGNLKILS